MLSNFVKTVDSVTIAYNHYCSDKDNLIIIVHGWFMTKDSKPFLELSEMFSNYYDVVAFDCRGHGKSSGSYSFTVQELMDLRAIVENFKDRYNKIYIIGFSLGAALSLIYVSKYNDIAKVIAVSPPTNFNKIENNIFSPNAWIPTLKKCELKTWFSIRFSFCKLIFSKKVNPIDIIDKIHIPVLFISGDNDPIIREWHTKKLYEKCLSDKKYISIHRGLHAEDLFLINKNKFVNDCVGWFK